MKNPVVLQIDNRRPVLKSAPTKATFTTSTTLWSDTVVTWSDSVALWGGSDPKQDKGPVLHSIGFVTSEGSGSENSGIPMGLLMSLTYP